MKDYSKIAIIGDADTIRGFEIAGVANRPGPPTIVEVTREDSEDAIAEIFAEQINRKDIAIVFICDFASRMIAPHIKRYKGTLPSVMIIPSKNRY